MGLPARPCWPVPEMGLVIEERGFSLAEALAAEEAFVTSATMLVSPVVRLDGQQIGSASWRWPDRCASILPAARKAARSTSLFHQGEEMDKTPRFDVDLESFLAGSLSGFG